VRAAVRGGAMAVLLDGVGVWCSARDGQREGKINRAMSAAVDLIPGVRNEVT